MVFTWERLLAGSRLFRILAESVRTSEGFDARLYGSLVAFLEAYVNQAGLSEDQVAASYNAFIVSYNRDLALFGTTGKYPLQLDPHRVGLSRTDYSVVLLLSTVLTVHRYRIMQLLVTHLAPHERVLCVGCGPGLELALMLDRVGHVDGYDTEMDPHLAGRFPGATLRAEAFRGGVIPLYDGVVLIEILEHLDDPYSLLGDCASVLRPGGRIYVTTATNIPQYDHRYNFADDPTEFEGRAAGLGLAVGVRVDLPHRYLTSDVKAKNTFYVLER